MNWAILFVMFVAGVSASAESLNGRWDGIISFGGLKVPFTMQLDFSDSSVTGSFLNGDSRIASTGGSYDGAALRLDFAQYGARLEARVKDNSLKGTYGSERFGRHVVEASLFCSCSFQGEAGPDITGSWLIPRDGTIWRLTVRRKGEDTSAILLRDARESGVHTGRFDGLQFTLSHFDGSRASIFEIVPHKGGSLDLVVKELGEGEKKYRAAKSGPSF